ncbi:MAG: hypothetical protein JOZ02_02410 [Acidobacteria bacterium]|nr:hypothetical protein [Acidobacteriota bacterium]
MKVTAAQHVSAMLTSRQSPRGRGGYQTLYYTRDSLSPDEAGVIERLVQYYSARDGEPKWQSYRLTDRRHVISRIVPIAEPDDFGRRGRYFTHSIICDVTHGPQFDAVLFSLLRPQNFLPSLDKALAADGMSTGDAPAVTLDVGGTRGDGGQGRLRDWSGEELNRLYILLSDPRRLTEQGQHVALVGGEGQILEALQVAFLLAPPDARKFCSFDTNAPGNDAPPGAAFWGRGSGTASASGYVIDAARRRVTVPESAPLWADGFSPERLSSPWRQAVVTRLSQPSDGALRCLVERRYRAFIGESAYQGLLSEAGLAPTPDDLELLAPFARAHEGLGLLLALKSGDDAERLRRLAAIGSSSAYREHCTQLRRCPEFKPWHVFSPIFMPTWFSIFRGSYRMEDLTIAVAKIAEHGSESDHRHLETISEHLDAGERQALGRWLKESAFGLEHLQATLDAPAAVPTRDGSAAKSRSFLRRILPRSGR